MQLVRAGMLVCSGIALLVTTAASVQAQKKSHDLITRVEIDASPKKDGYIFEVIRSLRPHMLEAPRGVRTTGVGGGSNRTEVSVFMDGRHIGGIEMLQSILASSVEEVRYMDPAKATDEFGLTLGGGGAVVIKSRNDNLEH